MSAQSQSKNASEWLLGAWKKNPEGFLLLAAGCALLLRSGSSSREVSSQQYSDAGSQSHRGTAARMMEGAKQYGRDAAEYAGDLAEETAGYAAEARRVVGEQSERVMEQAKSTARSTLSTAQSSLDRLIQERPLLVAMAGLAAGAAVAATFRATDLEKQTLGPIGEQVTERAQRFGEQVKEATAEAGNRLKQAAEQRGLTPEGVKEVAKEVAGAFSNSMSGESQPASGKGETGTTRRSS